MKAKNVRILKDNEGNIYLRADKDFIIALYFEEGDGVDVVFTLREEELPSDAKPLNIVLKDMDQLTTGLVGSLFLLNYADLLRDFPEEFIPIKKADDKDVIARLKRGKWVISLRRGLE